MCVCVSRLHIACVVVSHLWNGQCCNATHVAIAVLLSYELMSDDMVDVVDERWSKPG